MNYKIRYHEDESTCLECGTPISGRKDKKFCCTDCKNIYNNRSNRKIKRYKNSVVSILSNNYAILDRLLKCNVSHIAREDLLQLGYDQRYITGHSGRNSKHEDCSCFDIHYYQSESKIFNLRRMSLSEELIGPLLAPSSRL